ncbi:hypothetical protein SprV_0301256500 [Sparganum proliferum]
MINLRRVLAFESSRPYEALVVTYEVLAAAEVGLKLSIATAVHVDLTDCVYQIKNDDRGESGLIYDKNESNWHLDDVTRCPRFIPTSPPTLIINADRTPEPPTAILLLLLLLHCLNIRYGGSSIRTTTAHNPDMPTNINLPAVNVSDVGFIHTCLHCNRTFTSYIGLVGRLRIHRTETGEPVPGASTYTRCIRLQCQHCPRTFTHRMGLFGHMRVHKSGIGRSLDTPGTSCTSTMPSSTHTPPPSTPTTISPTILSTFCTPTTSTPTHPLIQRVNHQQIYRCHHLRN